MRIYLIRRFLKNQLYFRLFKDLLKTMHYALNKKSENYICLNNSKNTKEQLKVE